MTCTNGNCAYEFCWMCRGPWSEHGTATGGWYQCNKYDSSKDKQLDQSAKDTKTELETYMFYYHRYESHFNAGVIFFSFLLLHLPVSLVLYFYLSKTVSKS